MSKASTNREITVEMWFLTLIDNLEKHEFFATGRNYRKTLCSLRKFADTEKMYISDITEDTVCAYHAYLLRRRACRNTISFYMRILRAACNKAADNGYMAPDNSVFDSVFTGVDVTRKRALDTATLQRIARLDLPLGSEMDFSRDLFLFSFYTRGMNFVDMAHLSQDNISHGILSYIRSKTGQGLSMEIEPCMESIIHKWQKYATNGRVFPIITETKAKKVFEQYQYRLTRHNLMLKEIGRLVKTHFPLTSYAARHSWASLAQRLDIPLSVISCGMGHTSERTTRIYLEQLDNSKIDKANRRIIRSIFD